MSILEVRNLSLAFGGVKALDSVSFEVKPGETVGVIGPNGAGKTSLVNTISRYYSPLAGDILFEGKSILRKKPYQLPNLGISRSFQECTLPGTLSVLENVMIGEHHLIKTNLLRALLSFNYLKNEERKARTLGRETMRTFARIRASSETPQDEAGFPDLNGKGGFPDLLDVQDTPTAMLPYGVKKNLDLARALVARPKLLMLDEPASGLESSGHGELINLIKKVQSEFNTAVLLIEHQLPLVMQLCDRVIVLDFGKKIAEGTPDEIRQNPQVIEAYFGKKSAVEVREQETGGAAKEVKTESSLKVKRVDLDYGNVRALSGVSCNFMDGSITAILGGNGAGKSSLLKAISGLKKISSGEVLFNKERLQHYLQEPKPDRVVREKIIHVAEGRRIFKELSVMENLKLAGYTISDKRRVASSIEKVFQYFPVLKTKLNIHDAGNLSGGQQQMLAIGQALIMEPKVLLLDEPSLGLSPNLVQELFENIRRISLNENCTIVLVEQNIELALRYSKYAYFLDSGIVIKHGYSGTLAQDAEIKNIYFRERN